MKVIQSLECLDGDLQRAVAGQSVTLTLADEIDCSRGDIIAAADNPPEASDQFETTIIWMADEALLAGRPYWLKIGARTVTATITDIKYKININTLEHTAAKVIVTPPRFPEELAELEGLLQERRALESSLAHLKLIRRGNELVLRLDATALFDSGDDRLKPESLPALAAIADQVRERKVQVRVEGHTDDIPIRTLRFRSNWDLATARATSASFACTSAFL